VKWAWPLRRRGWEYLVVVSYREGSDPGGPRWYANGTEVAGLYGANEGAMLNYFGVRGWELLGREGWYFKRARGLWMRPRSPA
jgi:hypothetical protein